MIIKSALKCQLEKQTSDSIIGRMFEQSFKANQYDENCCIGMNGRSKTK